MKIFCAIMIATVSLAVPAFAGNCGPQINRLFEIKNRLDSAPRNNRAVYNQLVNEFNQQNEIVRQCNQNDLANAPQDPFWARQNSHIRYGTK